MVYDYRWYKKELKGWKKFTDSKMELDIQCKDEQELKAYKEASKGMRGIKNLGFKLADDEIDPKDDPHDEMMPPPRPKPPKPPKKRRKKNERKN